MARPSRSGIGSAESSYWTNRSVLSFAGTEDPILAIRNRVHSLVLNAIQEGWTGPPFDPFKLAEFMKIEVSPSQEVVEARTVPYGSRFRIEYNPNRGTNRARYSVAHEIVHTLFSDCADAIRHRQPYHRGDGDSWQLEMLCNIGAGEILMPVGSGLECPRDPQDFVKLLDLREEYKVSTEALLLRLSRLCGISVFAASMDAVRDQPVINYSILNFPDRRLMAGTFLPADSAVSDCTAIGFTAQGHEKWPGIGPVYVQCVGVPPYPGQVRPRVVGIVRSEDIGAPPHRSQIEYIRGDATQPRGAGKRIIVQIVNDKAFSWGGGFSLAVRRKWPRIQKEYSISAQRDSHFLRLGNVHFSQPTEEIVVASLVAQSGYGPSPRPRIRYRALECGLDQVARQSEQVGATVHMPRLGCGEAGGNWSVVRELVETNLTNRGIPVTVYDLPGPGAAKTSAFSPRLFG